MNAHETGAGDCLAPELVRIALRDNPLRRHLIVSLVLGKHIPARPHSIVAAARELAELVSTSIRNGPGHADAIVIGFAETATGLSESVAHALDAQHSGHSTRYLRDGDEVDTNFSEDHSHASEHAIVSGVIPRSGYSQVVIVDDELTTGNTALNLVAEVHALRPTAHFTIAALIDARTPAATAAMAKRCTALGINVTVVALAAIGGAEVTEASVRFEALGLAAAPRSSPAPLPRADERAVATIVSASWPHGLDLGSRRGWGRAERATVRERAAGIARELAVSLSPDLIGTGDVLVLGTEEFMYLPLLVAEALESTILPGRVWSSSTTRSPGLVLDSPGYGLRSGFSYRIDLPGEPQALRFAYNTWRPGPLAPFSAIIVCCDDVTTARACVAPEGLAAMLAESSPRTILLQLTPGGES